MSNAFEVFKFYLSAKLHFKDPNFDITKNYVKASVSSFEKRSDRYVFEKIWNKRKKNFKYYIIANLIENSDKYIRDFTEEPYSEMKRMMSNLGYFLNEFISKFDTKQDLLNCIVANFGNCTLMNMYKKNEVRIELLCVFNNVFHLTEKWKEDQIFSFIYEKEIIIIEKYSIFFTDYTDFCKEKLINKYDL